jgi:hypothetical protein
MSGALFANATPTLDFADADGGSGLALALLVEFEVAGTIDAPGRFGSVSSPSFEAGSVFAYVDDATPGSLLATSNDWQGSGGTIGLSGAWDYALLSSGVHGDPGDRVYLTWTTDRFCSALGSSGNNPMGAADVNGAGLIGLQDLAGVPRRNCRFASSPTPAYPDSVGGGGGVANFYPIDALFTPDAAEPHEGSVALALDLAAAGSGARRSVGVTALGVGMAVAGTGARASAGAIALDLAVALAGAGARAARGAAALTLGLAVSAAGVGQALIPGRLRAAGRTAGLTARGRSRGNLTARGGF